MYICNSTEVSSTQRGKQVWTVASLGRFPREKAPPEPGFKGPTGVSKQTVGRKDFLVKGNSTCKGCAEDGKYRGVLC